MDESLKRHLKIYGLGPAIDGITELEERRHRGLVETMVKQREVLEYLVASTRRLIEGRDEGYINNVRRLAEIKYLTPDEVKIAIDICLHPVPLGGFESLIELARIIACSLPNFKENCSC